MIFRVTRRLRATTARSGCGAATPGVCPCSDEVIACGGERPSPVPPAETGALAIGPGNHAGPLHSEDGGEGRATTITLQGTDPATSTIDGEYEFGAVELSDATFLLRDLTVRGGWDYRDPHAYENWTPWTYGGGIAVRRANVTLERVSVAENRASAGGGLALFDDAVVTVRNSEVLRNDASFGGGVALAGPGAVLHTEDTDWGSGEDDNTEAADLAFVQDPDVLGGMDLPDSGALTCSWDERACRE